MIARKCDICGEFFTPYLASNTISGKRDSYYQIKVTENNFTIRDVRTRHEYDVCMECKKKFINWVKDEKRKAKK